MAARKTKTDDAPTAELVDEQEPATEVVKVVPRPNGLEAVYTRQPDGSVTRSVCAAGWAAELVDDATAGAGGDEGTEEAGA